MLFKLIIEANKKIQSIFLFADTKITKIQNIGYIAKLDANKKEILNVYLDRKSACKLNNYKSLASLDEPVKQFKISNGYYYILYNDCDDLLINEFEKKYGKNKKSLIFYFCP
jgi:ribosomal protein S6